MNMSGLMQLFTMATVKNKTKYLRYEVSDIIAAGRRAEGALAGFASLCWLSVDLSRKIESLLQAGGGNGTQLEYVGSTDFRFVLDGNFTLVAN